jgi:hypothetical protein
MNAVDMKGIATEVVLEMSRDEAEAVRDMAFQSDVDVSAYVYSALTSVVGAGELPFAAKHVPTPKDAPVRRPGSVDVEYKMWPEYFIALERGEKRFEVRARDPHKFVQKGGLVRFIETMRDDQKTGRSLIFRIGYVLDGFLPDHIVFALEPPEEAESERAVKIQLAVAFKEGMYAQMRIKLGQIESREQTPIQAAVVENGLRRLRWLYPNLRTVPPEIPSSWRLIETYVTPGHIDPSTVVEIVETKREFDGKTIFEGPGYYGLLAPNAPMRSHPGLAGWATRPHWCTADGLYEIPSPTHWRPISV